MTEATLPTTPVISNLTLHGLPNLIRSEFGERTLVRAVRTAGVDLEAIEEQNYFIPHAAVLSLIGTTARAAGDSNFGLLMVPQMDVSNYGTYGRYLCGAETLGAAIRRAIEALPFHSTGDNMGLVTLGDEARYSYGFALAGRPGYEHAVNVAAGVLSSLCRFYASAAWRPRRIELDIPRPRHTGPFEDLFNCPVVFDAQTMTVVFDRYHLDIPLQSSSTIPIITIADVARDRRGGAPQDRLGVIAEHIRHQVQRGNVSIDRTAHAMNTSIRTLQRELNSCGLDFRSLANIARAERARELLQLGDVSVARIAAEMGYSTPANFSRAFRNATGLSPGEFRATKLQ
jgi:AraC-like DNA-binding protein